MVRVGPDEEVYLRSSRPAHVHMVRMMHVVDWYAHESKEPAMIAMPPAVEVPLRMDEGGVMRIGSARVTLQALVADFHRVAWPEEIVHHYYELSLSDVYGVVGY